MSLFALETATRIAWDALFCFTFLFLNTDKQRTLWTTFGLYERVHCKDESLTCGLNEFCFLLSSICKSTTRRIWETGEIWKYSKCTELFWSYEQCIVSSGGFSGTDLNCSIGIPVFSISDHHSGVGTDGHWQLCLCEKIGVKSKVQSGMDRSIRVVWQKYKR